jgi:hypothetical protein
LADDNGEGVHNSDGFGAVAVDPAATAVCGAADDDIEAASVAAAGGGAGATRCVGAIGSELEVPERAAASGRSEPKGEPLSARRDAPGKQAAVVVA